VSGDRPRRRGLLLVLTTLVPLCLVGGLVWLVAHEPVEGMGPHPTEESPPAASVSPTPSGAPSDGGERRTAGEEKPLAGRTVVLDPGHNPTNYRHPDRMSHQVDIGTKRKNCDTTGTATDAGYPEADFTLDVSRRVRAELEKQGATVRLTQNGDRPWGPCIDERAALGNEADADAVVSIHADGAGDGNRGFHVIAPEPVHEGKADTRAIAKPSRRLGEALVTAFGRATGTHVSTYAGGGDGLVARDDLGGLNLSRVPKVFLECGNMRDPQDAALLTDPAWRERAAHGVAEGLRTFLTGESGPDTR
jgi:N-acetylmuramoyl-L-alanine amidase